MLTRDIKENKLDYTVLGIICAVFVLYFILDRSSSLRLFISSLTFAAFYLAWGIWHHYKNKTLRGEVVLEYFLVSALGVVIVSTLLL